MKRSWLLLLLCLFLTAVTRAAAPDRLQTLERLADPDYTLRQTATHQLLTDPTLTDDDLIELVRLADLPEQRHRLTLIARHRLIDRLTHQRDDGRSRGCLGLTHHGVAADQTPFDAAAAVRVVSTYPGLPAYAHLQPGDLILAVNGQPLTDKAGPNAATQALVQTIQQMKCGDPVELAIVRDGERKTVEFRLSSLSVLRAIHQQGVSPFEDQWRALHQQLLWQQPDTPPLIVQLPGR